MDATDDFSQLLPGYLTDETRKKLEVALKNFIKNGKITQDPFSSFKNDFFLQGDIVSDIPFPYFSDNKYTTHVVPRCIILSNTCDIDVNNPRDLPMDCLLAPLFDMQKIENILLSSGASEEKIKNLTEDIKKYRVTNLFYLPIDSKGSYAPDEKGYVVSLDKTFSIPRKLISIERHIKSLNQFFSYLFTFKLSLHFCRFHDKVDRDENICY
ncbi:MULTISPECIES: hypothetical protein [Acinetobacter]|uniref:Uncharacterized protein n=1 Tax=Acinetobacter baylyi (strain ATCC 33305 / BD413 / ADP1) TaxID=62977 RepID=Q6FAH6_ACIAD|nr:MULTISPECIES: hypothetical protein [Acinetobacter]ENV53871.1 hypothetical protein F952_01924 [Acinetobacter baylyi DSM 14961 = CIP 107474]KAF2373160.1 hypothetical protein BSL88_00545 [Acinetobacter baylyi]KAF2374425.1 hypothetical protein BSL67_07375 [Acinetobacter baylyi]KAF2377204.1 hypothetical protein BSN81_10090 [Acinetobacter baylyi]KAF2380992.1 hypothetical protein BSN83_07630 [Acinetobacter baylyi]